MLATRQRLVRSAGRQLRMMSSLTVASREDGVATVMLNSPKTRNALSLEMMEQLQLDIDSAAKDQDVRAIVIKGEGKVFSAGHNLKEMTTKEGIDYHRRIFSTCENLMLQLTKVEVPVVGVVTGIAAAAGCQLVASCDIVVAGPLAKFSTPGAAVGLFCHTPGVPLARRVPRAVSGYMLLTGEPISAEEALRAGLVSKVVEEQEIQAEVDKICEAIKSKPRAVIELGKKFYHKQMEMGLSGAYQAGGEMMAENLRYRDAQEGIAAFKEKRKPEFDHSDKKAY